MSQAGGASAFFDLAKLLIAAFLSAGLSGIWVSRWKASLDHAEKRIDDLCSEVMRLADLASEYWLLEQTDPKVPVLQARLSSGIVRLASIRVSLAKLVVGLDGPRVEQLEAAFFRAATGGDFAVHNRPVSSSNAAAVQHAAGALLVHIRTARMASLRRSWLPKV
ncbi:hypothetical protein [Bradyrhizobium sp. CCGUVB23]|uniref:hypothetical protein n=1 Tax=Bradyrhizobium sp. CCGUVB23 TaxID=2949630 RepID=UPI0020B1B140|nr:hypothetical protein [Bradyrhizobium sp. CCGUVB23]MCP3467992.1 hypothetical protein [Bradyrhizobium sp. CCGUVB23]